MTHIEYDFAPARKPCDRDIGGGSADIGDPGSEGISGDGGSAGIGFTEEEED